MPGHLRKRLGKGITEQDYERARQRVIRASQICWLCGNAVDLKLKPICRRVQVDLKEYPVERGHEIPTTCGPDCSKEHGTKANPWSASADHIIPVSKLRPGDPRLTDHRAMRTAHLHCNRQRGAGEPKAATRYTSSKDYFTE